MGKVFDTNWKRYFAAVLITLVVFSIGLGMGYIFSIQTEGEVRNIQSDIEQQLLSTEVQKALAEEYICETDIFRLTEEKVSLGRKLAEMEKNFGPEDERVTELKRKYSLISLQQMLLVKDYNKICDDRYATVLFFYSNKKNVSESESQGYVLDYIYNKYSDEVIIYSFDFDLDEPALNTLKEVHGVKTVPSIVVNGTTYENLRNRQEVEEILTEQTHLNLTER